MSLLSKPPRRIVNEALLWTMLLAGGTFGGLALAAHLKVRAQRAAPAPSRVIAVHSLNEDPRPAILDGIRFAKREILISAKTLGWESVLTALKERAAAGVRVVVLLDGGSNRDPRQGPLGWLLHYRVGEVYTSSPALQEQVMIIDGSFVIVSSAPWTPGNPRIGVTFFMADAAAAAEYRSGYEKALQTARKHRA